MLATMVSVGWWLQRPEDGANEDNKECGVRKLNTLRLRETKNRLAEIDMQTRIEVSKLIRYAIYLF